MIELIKQRYGSYLHSAILTGDAMGKARMLGEKDNASHYLQLQRGLGLASHQVKVPANPTHENSRAEVNDLLWISKQPGSTFHFSLNPLTMPNTCRDNRNVQCDATGAIMKGSRKDLNQRADYLDTERYFINLTAKPILLRLRK
jgi:hypothetical protein